MRQFNPKKIKDYIDKIFQRHTYHKSRKSHNHFGTPIKPSDVGSYGRRYVEDDENDFVDEVSRSWPADLSFCLQLLTRCLGKQYKKLIAKLEALVMRANTLYKVGEYCSAFIILRVMSEEVDEVTSIEIRFRIFTTNSLYLEQSRNQWHLWGQRWYGPTWLRAWEFVIFVTKWKRTWAKRR